jgi:hypothetical protein
MTPYIGLFSRFRCDDLVRWMMCGGLFSVLLMLNREAGKTRCKWKVLEGLSWWHERGM